MWSEYFTGIYVYVMTVTFVEQVSCYGYKFANNGDSSDDSQQSSGLFWNNFRAYPQTQVQSIPVQIKFEDTNESEEDPEYMYELLFGHQIRDMEKYKRQKGCLCNNRFRDPHCGTDYKLYDNGCYFECAQKRNPGLKLLTWGKC